MSAGFWRSTDLTRVQTKLRCGTNVNAMGNDYSTPLHLAAQANGDPAVIQALLDAGAYIEAKNTYGESPLHYAALNWNSPIIRVLIEGGASIEATDNKGRTPLHYATGGDLYRPGVAHNPVIPIVHSYGDPLAIRTLVDAGASVEAKDEEGRTPLHYAVGLDGLEPTTSVLSGVLSKTNRIQAASDTKCQVRCLLFLDKTVVNYALTGGSSMSL